MRVEKSFFLFPERLLGGCLFVLFFLFWRGSLARGGVGGGGAFGFVFGGVCGGGLGV